METYNVQKALALRALVPSRTSNIYALITLLSLLVLVLFALLEFLEVLD